MKILIESIPHEAQRYPTVGDWFYVEEPGTGEKILKIRISRMSDPRMMEASAIHELFEALACNHAGVTQESVDQFDTKYEEDRKAGLHGENDEPGDDPTAPYAVQHGYASAVERTYATAVGLDWNKYANEVSAFP